MIATRLTCCPETIAWVHGATLKPLLEYCRHLNIPVESGLEQNHFPSEPIDVYHDVFAQQLLSDFFCDMNRLYSLSNLGYNAAVHAYRTKLDWIYSQPTEPTLYLALTRALAWIKGHTCTHFHLLEDTDAVSIIREQSELPEEAEFNFGSFELETVINIVRHYLGEDWQPEKIWLPCYIFRSPEFRLMFPYAQILPLDKYWRFDIPRHYLTLAPLPESVSKSNAQSDKAYFDEPVTDCSFVGVCKRIFRTYLRSQSLNLKSAAELMSMSPRTLQRKFHQKQVKFSDVLEEVRFELAKQILNHTDRPIVQVAEEVGYECPSNFARSFRRLYGISPREYRKKQLIST